MASSVNHDCMNPVRRYAYGLTESRQVAASLIERDLVHYAAREFVHRIKNLLTVVQAISLKVSHEVTTKDQYRNVLSDRLVALSIAQDVLVRHDWQDAPIDTVIDSALAAFLPNPGLSLRRGPDAFVPARLVRGLSMALYELATNAVKYGALVEGRGPVALWWHSEDGNMVLEWDEKTSTSPNRVESFGTNLIHSALCNEPKTSVCYRLDAEGVYARFQWTTVAPRLRKI